MVGGGVVGGGVYGGRCVCMVVGGGVYAEAERPNLVWSG